VHNGLPPGEFNLPPGVTSRDMEGDDDGPFIKHCFFCDQRFTTDYKDESVCPKCNGDDE
jgi:hypothetical protein